MAEKEYGRLGQKRYGGTFYEEFLPELRGRRGIAVYYEMSENDDTVGAVLTAIELLLRQATWRVDPAGPGGKDAEAAEFVEQCRADMQDTWTDTLSEILSFLIYGWSLHEIVYKRRLGRGRNPAASSKYNDGLIGWQKLPIRAQETLYEWVYDAHDNLVAMRQLPPPDYGVLEIPMSKALLFRTKVRKGNPEGRSILRNAYRSWYYKRRIQEIEGIGIERDLAGLPVITAPERVDIFGKDPKMELLKAELLAYVKNIRRDEQEGVILPFGYKLELLSTGGNRQFDTNTIINRYDTRIAMTMMGDFILLGHQGTGSYALSSDKSQLFREALKSYLDIICEVFNNQAIPRLIEANRAHFQGITDYPKLVHGDVEHVDLGVLGEFLQRMASSGILLPDEGLEDYVRETARLPERIETEEGGKMKEQPAGFGRKDVSGGSADKPGGQETDGDEGDLEAAEAAKRRLGRR